MEEYQNKLLSPEKRAKSLLSSMTLREKVGQLNQHLYGFRCYDMIDGEAAPNDLFRQEVDKYSGIGALYGLFRADPWSQKNYENGITAAMAPGAYNTFQRYVIEHSRLGIPMLMSSECPHGHQALDGYLLPVSLAMGCTFHPELVKKAFSVCAAQLEAMGVQLALVSVLDVLRDPRWGRSEESFGEDPYLCSLFAQAVVQGVQSHRVAAVAKHFCAQGQCTGGLNASPAPIGERELREIHLPAMQACCEAGVKACMAAYNEIDGIPCHANPWLLNQVLRKELGFDGVVMADGCAIDRLAMMTGNPVSAGALALSSGVDMSLWDDGFAMLEAAVEKGLVSEDSLDAAVLRVLRLKFELGLFENPYVDEKNTFKCSYDEFTESLDLARESVVLLENKGQLLPLDKGSVHKIAVIGPHADTVYGLLGDYTPPVRRRDVVTLLDGICKEFPDAEIKHTDGCGIRSGEELFLKEEVIEAASWADVVIMALGGSSERNFDLKFDANGAVLPSENNRQMDCGEGADLADLELGGCQKKLADIVFRTGKPVITVIIGGRPYAISELAERSASLLYSFYAGPRAGQAIAEIISGKTQPSGRLSVSIPAHAGQLPVYYNYKNPGADLNYVDRSRKPLYSFGYGLSTTRFGYSHFEIDCGSLGAEELQAGMHVHIRFTVQNTGNRPGFAVCQLYIQGSGGSITRRIKELKGFQKVKLEPGECKAVSFPLGWQELCVWGSNQSWVAEKSKIRLMIGDMGQIYWSSIFLIC